ncbi:heavy metal-associated isoprenylated plant protein 24 [Euphorbia lathyris]|uniref:heavy metal-associated isoprenylated plant protein 24 n=1 Tax=Euphorbia lathyris TaxID=212925 RepID=UPI0033130FA8
MGVAGTMEYLSELLYNLKKHKKKKQIQTVALKIRMDCKGCQRKVKNVLSRVKGVKSVDVDMKQQKVTVTGYIEAKKVLKAAESTKKKVELWPYVPYTLVSNPYVSLAYDKKAPPNHVRAIPTTATVTDTTVDQHFIDIFSDENPNACSIM